MNIARLEKRDPPKNMARSYRTWVTPALFGSRAVVREWGRIFGRFAVRRWRVQKGALSSDSSTAAAFRIASMSRRCERTTSTPSATAASTMAASERRYPGEQVRANPAN